MSALIHAQPDCICPPRADAAAWSIWYGCPGGACHSLPIGAVFGVVYSPDRKGNLGWRYIRFRVDMKDARAGTKHATGKLSRVYDVTHARNLSAEEIAHFEQLISHVEIGAIA